MYNKCILCGKELIDGQKQLYGLCKVHESIVSHYDRDKFKKLDSGSEENFSLYCVLIIAVIFLTIWGVSRTIQDGNFGLSVFFGIVGVSIKSASLLLVQLWDNKNKSKFNEIKKKYQNVIDEAQSRRSGEFYGV